jgi:hypothetical protein
MIAAALACQLVLLAYHQATTFLDLHPFNGARHYTSQERIAEMATNAVLMGLAPIGFAFGIRALQVYGAWYYFVLFGIELTIWWVPYFVVPQGAWRRAYNLALGLGTSDFQPGDTLGRWQAIHARIHAGTTTVLPRRAGRITPNLEHMLLHAGTLVTAIVTLHAVRS